MNAIHLFLTYKWFDLTARGSKTTEYRDRILYHRPIWLRRHELTHVIFHRGYTSTTITVAITGIDIGPCPIPGWRGDYIRIHFNQP